MVKVSNLNISTIRIITIGKVASSAFKHSLHEKYKISHSHSLLQLKETLENETDTLIISGIRNPLNRNISYFFQTYSDEKNTGVLCEGNKYKGDKCYIMKRKAILNTPTNELIRLFFKQKWHHIFDDWFEEFFRLTQINSVVFPKELGYLLYPLDNNNWVLFYTFEKFLENTAFFESFFDIPELKHTNKADDRIYKDKYKSMKETIKFPKSYKQKLLDTRVIKHFYAIDDIKQFYI
jgi:hypothetical protein